MTIKQILLAGIMLSTIGNIGSAMEPEEAMTPITKWTDVEPFANTVVAYSADSYYLDSATIRYRQEGSDYDYTSHKPSISSNSELNYGYIKNFPREWNKDETGYQLCKLQITGGVEGNTALTDSDITDGSPFFMRPITPEEAAKIIVALNSQEAIFSMTSNNTKESIKKLLETSIKK